MLLGCKAASITITPSALQSLTVSPTTVAGGSNTTGTVSFLSPVSSPQEVAISENSSALQTPPSVTVATGQKTASFPIATGATASTFTRQVTATHQGVSRTANVTVVPATLLSITVSPSTVEGRKPSTGTVTFNGKVAQAVFVSLASNSSAVQVPANVFVPAGQKSVAFQITTSKVTATSTRQVAANYNGVVKTASITLQP